MFTSSRVGLLTLCENARNSCLILALAWIAVACGLSSTGSAQPVELQEVLSLDGFFGISDIAVGRDGSIYIADHQSFALSKYDPQGRLIRQVGSQGVAPSEFVNGPHLIVLIDSILVATDQKGTGVLHYFDLDLSYERSDQIETPVDMDVALDGQFYLGNLDLITLDMHVATFAPPGDLKRIFKLKDMHKYNMENQFILLAGNPGRIVVVFQMVNRIDVYDLSGNILNQLSVANLPLRYEGSFMDLEEGIPLPDHMAESISYVPGGMMFTGAALDHQGNLFLEHGGKAEETPVRRSVYVMTLSGEEKGIFEMPPYTRLAYMDGKGYAYAVTTAESSTLLKKYKLVYLE